MTHTNQTVNSIGAGVRFQVAAVGDSYLVANNVRLTSTDAEAIASAFAESKIEVQGRVTSATSAAIHTIGAASVIEIEATGIVTSNVPSNIYIAVWAAGGSGTITNAGRINAPNAIGVVTDGNQNTVENSGIVKAASAVFLGLSGSSGDHFENSGTLMASANGATSGSYRYNNGVFTEGDETVVTNLKSGSISAISSEGAGIAIGSSGGDGTIVTNRGTVSSANWYGVDFANMVDTEIARLNNSGTISGGTGSFRGNESGERISNSGTMNGDVLLNGGDDYFSGSNGTVVGSIKGGTGDDIILAGRGNQTVFGEAGNDILNGGLGKDVLRGGADIDRFVFATGYGKDIAADFVGGTDLVDLSGWKAVHNFAAVKSHGENHGGDLWIVAGNDVLVLDNTKVADLHAASFIF